MKTAIYIVDGVFQIVLTPESDFEKTAFNSIVKGNIKTDIYKGSFYTCQGGWDRQGFGSSDNSIIIRNVANAD